MHTTNGGFNVEPAYLERLQRNSLTLDTRRAGEGSIAIRRDGATPYQKLNYSAVFFEIGIINIFVT